MVRRRRVARTEGGGRDPRALPQNTWSPVSSCHFSAMLRARCSRSRLDSMPSLLLLLAAMDEDDLDLRLRVNSAREENLSIGQSSTPSCEGIKSRIGIGSNQSKGRCGTTWDGYRRCCHDWRARVPRVVCGSGGRATFVATIAGAPPFSPDPIDLCPDHNPSKPLPLQLKKKGGLFLPTATTARGNGGGRGGVLARRARGVGF